MKYTYLLGIISAALTGNAAAISVSGAAEGFAAGVSGGGSATPVYPKSLGDLVSYLGDDEPRVVILDKTFDFTGSEGTATGQGCAPWGTGDACQVAINLNNWCDGYQSSAPQVEVEYDKAGVEGITITSNKTILGVGSNGTIKGKGLRIANGASNVIIQNIAITDINPKYVWGGDGVTLDDCDLVWIDHVTTARIGRQHIVLGTSASNRVTISNNFIDGRTPYSATCNGYHYWGVFLFGSNDMATLKGNHIYHTSGRSPKVEGNTLLHAVNNYFSDNTGHAFELMKGSYVLAEGNVFDNVKEVVDSGIEGQAFAVSNSADSSVCNEYIGRSCMVNGFQNSGKFDLRDKGFLSNFRGKNVVSSTAYTGVQTSVLHNAGQAKL